MGGIQTIKIVYIVSAAIRFPREKLSKAGHSNCDYAATILFFSYRDRLIVACYLITNGSFKRCL